MALFANYDDWRTTVSGIRRMEPTRCCRGVRGEALADGSARATWDFVKVRGPASRDAVVPWHRKAAEEVVK